jgi:hypothetical protein
MAGLCHGPCRARGGPCPGTVKYLQTPSPGPGCLAAQVIAIGQPHEPVAPLSGTGANT